MRVPWCGCLHHQYRHVRHVTIILRDADLLTRCAVAVCPCTRTCTEAGSIGIVFDEGEEEDTVVIESIKKGTPASRKYGAQLEAGMLLTKCRGVDCAPLDFDGIIELLQDPARPLALTFEFLYEEESDG